jgi:hypothetical protein
VLVNAALRQPRALVLEGAVVADCLDLAQPADERFHRAWTATLGSLPRAERGGALAGVTGHVAESAVAVLLVDRDHELLWQFTGPGRHGVDLVVLTPDERVVGIEVKATLRPGHVPRMSQRAVAQMSAAWIDKVDNPGMASLQLGSADVYGAVIAINFADMTIRAVMTNDFEDFSPLGDWPEFGALGQ